MPSVSAYILGKYFTGNKLDENEGFQSTVRVFEAMQLDVIKIDFNNSETPEDQFWKALDFIFDLSEEGLQEELPYFVTDPREQDKVNAILEGRLQDALNQETSRQLN